MKSYCFFFCEVFPQLFHIYFPLKREICTKQWTQYYWPRVWIINEGLNPPWSWPVWGGTEYRSCQAQGSLWTFDIVPAWWTDLESIVDISKWGTICGVLENKKSAESFLQLHFFLVCHAFYCMLREVNLSRVQSPTIT